MEYFKMTQEQATEKFKQLTGKTEVFVEEDDAHELELGQQKRYYVGLLPKKAGAYTGYVGFSYEHAILEALQGLGFIKADAL